MPESQPPVPELQYRQWIGQGNQEGSQVVQYQVLAAMDKKHVLGIVVETGLHHPVTEQNAGHKHQNPPAPGPLPFRHQQQACAIEPQGQDKAEQGDRGKIVGQQVTEAGH